LTPRFGRDYRLVLVLSRTNLGRYGLVRSPHFKLRNF
jgi:hypothetical protein